jgi:hypothetical protein
VSFGGTAVEAGEAADCTPRPPLLPRIQFAVLSLAAQALVIYGLGTADRSGALVALLLVPAHLLLLPFLLRNFSLWGIRLITIGFALNLLVMSANGGLMPVDSNAVQAVGRHDAATLALGEHIPRTKNVYQDRSQTTLADLSDAIILPVPPPFTRAVSPGDIIITAGIGLVAVQLFAARRRYQARVTPQRRTSSHLYE